MRLRRLSARGRLTLLYTTLVAGCGGVLVAATYFLLAANLRATKTDTSTTPTQQFMDKCLATTQPRPVDESLKARCQQIYAQGVQAGASSQRDSTLSHLLWYSLGALLVVTAFAALASWVLAGRILRPVHQLTIAARNASENNLSQRLALTGPRDELRELADTFDEMLARLDEAFAGQRRFIANASHELRTPLTVMRTTLDVVLAKPAATNAELVAMGNDVRDSVEAAEKLIGALLTLARNERGRTINLPLDLAICVEDVLDVLPSGGLTMNLDLNPAPVIGDPILIERLLANLIDNAVRYNQSEGSVTVASGRHDERSFIRVQQHWPAHPTRSGRKPLPPIHATR